MKTLQQLWQPAISDPVETQNLASPHKMKSILSRLSSATALLLTLILLAGISLSAQADPGTTVLLPLISAAGDAPPPVVEVTAVDDRYQTFEDGRLLVKAANGVLVNDSASNGGPLQARLESDVSHGVLNLQTDGSFSYKPAPGFSGQDKFTYRAAGGTAVSKPAEVILAVSAAPVNNAPKIITGKVAFTKSVIGTGVKRAHSSYAADFDDDGDLDVVAPQYGKAEGGVGGMVYWYENNGDGKFTEKVLDPDLPGAYPSHIDDVDRDGDADILVGAYDSDTFAWYRNDGRANFKRINIDTNAGGAHSIVTNDLDFDGDFDLVTSWQDGNIIAWYENDGKSSFKRRIIDKTASGAKRAEVADIDGDGDKDIATASYWHEIAWLENDGRMNFTKHIIDADAHGAYYATPADVDGDGDIDLLTANQRDDAVVLYRNNGSQEFSKEIVDDNAIRARTVIAVDLDRDGDLDALAASVDDDTIAWHENDGSGHFSKRAIDRAAGGAYGVSAIDMDFDGDLDVLSACRDSGEIGLYSNIRAHNAAVKKRGALLIDATQLLTVGIDDSPKDLTYTITRAPQYGQLLLDGDPLPPKGTFTQADVDNGRLTYKHSGGRKPPDRFSFTVAGSGADAAQPAAGFFVINIT